MVKGIDVSKFQGIVDYKKVKASGVDFVIIKAGQHYSKNEMFEVNYAGAKAAGLHVGAYWYSNAMTAEEAKKEAMCCLDAIEAKLFDYPIYYDFEEQEQFDKGKTFCSEIVSVFCNELELHGCFAGLYISRSPLQTHIIEEIAKRYTLWIAEYNSKCNYNGNYGVWQYSGNGTCDGISGAVDLNYSYIDFPSIIVNGGFNGYGDKNAPTIPEIKEFHTGDKIKLNKAPLFVSAYAGRQSNTMTGDYYIHSDGVICERIRITTSEGNPVCTGWVNISDIS